MTAYSISNGEAPQWDFEKTAQFRKSRKDRQDDGKMKGGDPREPERFSIEVPALNAAVGGRGSRTRAAVVFQGS
jgi:hypothetical protein